jgi:ribosomal protein L15
MSVFVIVFMVIATLFALGSITYVVADVIVEKRQQKQQNTVVVLPVVAEHEPETEPEPEVMPEIVEHIVAEEADAMISDELAMQTVLYESPAGQGDQVIINIGMIDMMFEAGAVVTLEALKQKDLAQRKAGRLKVLAGGTLNKPLTIKAENYSVQAIKMIELTGGTVVILKD